MMGTLHFLPRLQHLVVIYADPNVETPCQTNAACDRCQNLGRSRTSVRFHKGPYADSKDKDKSHPTRPDRRSSRKWDGSWRFSLEMILDNGKPIVFTAYQWLEAEWEEESAKRDGGESRRGCRGEHIAWIESHDQVQDYDGIEFTLF